MARFNSYAERAEKSTLQIEDSSGSTCNTRIIFPPSLPVLEGRPDGFHRARAERAPHMLYKSNGFLRARSAGTGNRQASLHPHP